MGIIHAWIEIAVQGLEALAAVIMVTFILAGTVRWLLHTRREIVGAYASYRVALGKSLLVGLELLVATDILRTVALDTTMANIVTLGVLVLVRTFLGWTLTVEVEGRWPWQATAKSSRKPEGSS